MNANLFVNIPVKDLNAAKSFFTQLGFSFSAQFTDDNAACLVLGNNNYFMLSREEFFKSFTKKPIADTLSSAEAIFSFSVESREKVDELLDKAVAAGSKASMEEPMDLGFMYGRSFADLDGQLWEVFYMDSSHIQ